MPDVRPTKTYTVEHWVFSQCSGTNKLWVFKYRQAFSHRFWSRLKATPTAQRLLWNAASRYD